MNQLVRIGFAGAWRSGTADRVRSLLVSSCVALLVMVASGFLAASYAHDRAVDRVWSRGYTSAPVGEPAAYDRAVLFDVAPDGSQIVVVNWHLGTASQLPRGFPPGAVPDVFYLSPALAQLTAQSAVLRERFAPSPSRLDAAFIGQADELLAYRLTDSPTGMGERLAGTPGSEGIGEVTLPRRDSTAAPTVLLLGLPGLGLVWAASSVPATRLRRRALTLHTLGASRTQVALAATAQSMALVLPGAVAGVVAWRLLAAQLSTIPLTGLAVFPGDLALSGLQQASVVVGVAAVYTVFLARSSLSRGPSHHRRPSDVLPMIAIGLASLLAAPVFGGKTGFALLLGGIGALVLGAPALVERVCLVVGARLSQRPYWKSLLVGRRLMDAARGTARSQIAWLSLLVVTPAAACWIATVRLTDPQPASDVYIVQATSENVFGSRGWLEEQLDAHSAQVAIERLPVDDQRTPMLRLIADCSDMTDLLRQPDCPDGGDYELNPEIGSLAIFERVASTKTPAAYDLDPSSLLFFDYGDHRLEELLRAISVRTPGLSVSSDLTTLQRESPLVPYVLGALGAMTIVVLLALTLSIAGQAARNATSRRLLAVIGASRSMVARVAALEAAAAVGIAATSTIPLTAFALWTMRRIEPSTVLPTKPLVWIAVGMIGGTLVAAIAAAISTRSAAQPAE